MKITKGPFQKKFGPGLSIATIPAGLKVVPCYKSQETGKQLYWLDEFPKEVFSDFLKHDAYHYGVIYKEDEVEDAPESMAPFQFSRNTRCDRQTGGG